MLARLLLLPPHDPQFRRNRERVVRDAERENLLLEWDLGLPEDDAELSRPPGVHPRRASRASSLGAGPLTGRRDERSSRRPSTGCLNRELSWLDFNARVLALAEDPTASRCSSGPSSSPSSARTSTSSSRSASPA